MDSPERKDSVMKVRDSLKLVRRLVKSVVGLDVAHRAEIRLPATRFGGDYGGWIVYADHLKDESVIYSFGIGEDASFDLDLIERLGVEVHAFDPTPRSMAWIRDQNLPEAFRFHHIGIADFDGEATFNAPANPDFVSYTLTPSEGNVTGAVRAEVRRLVSIMEALGHDHVDVLKLDVEGVEYDVLTDILASNLDVRQILVEFHHAFRSISVKRTNDAIEQLRSHGYRTFYVSPGGEDYSFIRTDRLASA